MSSAARRDLGGAQSPATARVPPLQIQSQSGCLCEAGTAGTAVHYPPRPGGDKRAARAAAELALGWLTLRSRAAGAVPGGDFCRRGGDSATRSLPERLGPGWGSRRSRGVGRRVRFLWEAALCAEGSGTDPPAPFVYSTLSGCPEAAPKSQSAPFWSLGSDRRWNSGVPAPREEVGALRLSARRRFGAQRPRLHRHLSSASFSAAGRAESVDFGVWVPERPCQRAPKRLPTLTFLAGAVPSSPEPAKEREGKTP